jgi:hypothetical protein
MTAKNDDERDPGRPDDGAEDTEGHALLIDHATATGLHRARTQDIERQVRERLREKEARPNRDKK